MKIELGATHTMAVNLKGKVYCWGWNDNGQCAKSSQELNEVVIDKHVKQSLVFTD